MQSIAEILNSYILPGRVSDPLLGIEQAKLAEQLGVGGIVLSERWESKELASVVGALTQATRRVKLVAGLTHFGTRHPLVLAGMGATIQLLSKGRFVLGFGRGVPAAFRKLGIPVIQNEGMADYATILRRLWRGETISYHGPAGEYPDMQLAQPCPSPPPIVLGALGPKTLELAGSHFDGVMLHPFLTAEGVKRSVEIVRTAARKSGRDPLSVTVYAIVVTAPDTLSRSERATIVEARAVSYFMHTDIGMALVKMNSWDEAPAKVLAASGLSRLEYGQGDIAEGRRQMAAAAAALPLTWLETGAASGSIPQCADRLSEYVDAGADQLLLHGTTPDQQELLVTEMKRRAMPRAAHDEITVHQ